MEKRIFNKVGGQKNIPVADGFLLFSVVTKYRSYILLLFCAILKKERFFNPVFANCVHVKRCSFTSLSMKLFFHQIVANLL